MEEQSTGPKKTNASKKLGMRKSNTRLLRVLITPQQDVYLNQLRDQGYTESEHVRRALDDYFSKMLKDGQLKTQ
jgi:hypothetical protein